MAGRLQRETGGVRRQRKPDRAFSGGPGGRDEGSWYLWHCQCDTYEVKGSCPAEFWASAEGTLRFVMEDGSLPHVSLGEDMGGLRFTRFTGQARLQTGTIEMQDAALSSPAGKFRLSGTASLKGELDFNLARTSNGASAPGYTISGTLAEPRVIQSSSPDTQARLKAEPAKQP